MNPEAHCLLIRHRRRRSLAKRRSRRGFTMLELIVSATLFIALVSIVVPLGVRVGRLRQEARAYQLALMN